MRIRISIVLFLVLGSLYAQKTEKKEVLHPTYGKATEEKIYSDDGKLFNNLIYTNDSTYTQGNFEKGEWKNYYKNGKIKAKGTYVKPMKRDFFGRRFVNKTGEWLFYTEDGKLAELLNFKDNKENGEYITYHTKGTISGKGHYNNGKLNGLAKKFFENQQLHRAIEYKDGMVFNVKEFYDVNGKEIDCGSLKDGNGTLKVYDLASGAFLETITIKGGAVVKE